MKLFVIIQIFKYYIWAVLQVVSVKEEQYFMNYNNVFIKREQVHSKLKPCTPYSLSYVVD